MICDAASGNCVANPHYCSLVSQPLTQPRPAGIHLFTLAGIRVSLHWLWFVIAIYEISARRRAYGSIGWNVAEYVALFVIVLLHEFGHAFACRSVGGRADHIMLWPLGGVAFVRPPQRAGALLWSIAAGPLVNVMLAPFLWYATMHAAQAGLSRDAQQFVSVLNFMNLGLLIFNMLPIYPLDGGQILRALLWFVTGPATSLLVASILGIVGAVGGFIYLMTLIDDTEGRIWLVLIAGFAVMQSWQGIVQARRTAWLMAQPRHEDRSCPSCKQSPPAVPMWGCRCGRGVDPFPVDGICPHCATRFAYVPCPFCGVVSPIETWSDPRYFADGSTTTSTTSPS